MKHVIPAVIFALLIPMGLSAPPASALPTSKSASVTVTPRALTDDTLYVDASSSDGGNCTTDDTASQSGDRACRTIGAALSKAGDDSVIVVAAGEYQASLNIAKRLTIVGAGNTDDSRVSTVIKGTGGPTITYSKGGVADKPQRLRDVYITGGVGAQNSGAGILIVPPTVGEHFDIEGISVVANDGHGIAVSATIPVGHLRVVNSTIKLNGGVGVRVASEAGVESLTLMDDTILSNGVAAIQANPDGRVTTAVGNLGFTRLAIGGGDDGHVNNSDVYIANLSGTLNVNDVRFTGSPKGRSALVVEGVGATLNLNKVDVGGIYPNGALKLEKFNFASDDSLVMTNVVLDDSIVDSTRAHLQLAGVKGQIDVGNTRFGSKTPALDISLSSYSNADSTVDVDATDALFRDGRGSQMSLDQQFAQQSRIVDELTNSAGAKGLVTFVSDHVFALPPSSSRGIQRAINAASADDTVHVDAGTYAERVKIDKKGISLLGPNAFSKAWSSSGSPAWPADGRAVITGAGNPTTDVNGLGDDLMGAVTLLTNSDGATVRGFEISGFKEFAGINGRVVPANGGRIAVTNITIENNYILGSPRNGTGYGMYIDGNVQQPANAAVVRNLTVRGNRIIGTTTVAQNVTGMILGRQQGLTVEDNWLQGWDRGTQITLDPEPGGPTQMKVMSNVVKDIPLRGVQFAGTAVSGTTISILGNDFINVNNAAIAPTAGAELDSGMIRFSELLVLKGTVDITNNLFQQAETQKTGSAIAWNGLPSGAFPFANVLISNNGFDMPAGAKRLSIFEGPQQTDDSNTLMATGNYWGIAGNANAISGLFFSCAKTGTWSNPPGSWSEKGCNTAKATVISAPWIGQADNVPPVAGGPGYWPANTVFSNQLAGLTVSSGSLSPAFSPARTTYSVGVGFAVSSMTVNPSVVTGSGAVATATPSGGVNVPLNFGANSITITVTNPGQPTITYTINVSRDFPPPAPDPVPVPTPTPSPTASPSPSPSPTPTPSPSPTPSPAPVPSELAPGEALVIVDGQQQSVEVVPNPEDNGLVVEGEGWQMDLDATGPNGQPLNLTPEGALLLETEGDVVTSGTGFDPDSEVALYMDPPVGAQTSSASWFRAIVRQVTGTILVGTVPVNAQGIFSGRVALPPDVEPGQRMLQAVGTSPTGQTRALNLGVVVEPAKVPGAPTDVTPVPGNRQVVLTWTAPVRPGASPITGYRIEQSRNGGPWTVAIANTGSARPNAGTSAVVARLVNGDDYRFRVTAINAQGLGRVSEPSPSTSPEAPEGRSILITGARTTIDGKSGIRVRGETTGFTRKAILRPWTRFAGEKAFTEGRDRIRLDGKGAFSWQRQTKKSVTVYVQAGDGTRSNRVVIPAR